MYRLHYFIVALLVHNLHAEPNADLDDLQNFHSESDQLSSPQINTGRKDAATNLDDIFNIEDEVLWAIDDEDEQPVLSFAEKEKRVRDALFRITMDKNNRRTMTQILPILRSLSKAQKTALAALVSAQAHERNGNELSYEQVSQTNSNFMTENYMLPCYLYETMESMILIFCFSYGTRSRSRDANSLCFMNSGAHGKSHRATDWPLKYNLRLSNQELIALYRIHELKYKWAKVSFGRHA